MDTRTVALVVAIASGTVLAGLLAFTLALDVEAWLRARRRRVALRRDIRAFEKGHQL